jgi:glycosyltransferase involved in cell wall biosynthesis
LSAIGAHNPCAFLSTFGIVEEKGNWMLATREDDGSHAGRRLRFLHLTTFYPPYSFGGDGIYVYRLAEALARLGHQVDIIHCVDAYQLLNSAPPQSAIKNSSGVTVHGLRSGYGLISPLLTQQTGRPYLKGGAIDAIIKQRRPDVIHYHNISLFGPGVLRLGSGNEAVKLYTAHDHWLVCPMHVLWKFNRRLCDTPQCLRCSISFGRPPQLWRYTRMLERCASEVDAFLAPSRFSAEMHSARGFSRPMTHFPLFAPRADAEVPADSASPHPRPYFLFVGRLENIKGVESLIEAWAQVHDADLLIAGSGGIEPKLRELAATNPRVVFLGHRSSASLGPLYRHCIACIVPSLVYEVFPTVVLEAFAHKAPLIARNRGGLTEIITESDGGLLFTDEEELLAAVERLAGSSALRTSLGENGYRAFVAKWSPEAHLKSYFELIDRIALRKFGRMRWQCRPDSALTTAAE